MTGQHNIWDVLSVYVKHYFKYFICINSVLAAYNEINTSIILQMRKWERETDWYYKWPKTRQKSIPAHWQLKKCILNKEILFTFKKLTSFSIINVKCSLQNFWKIEENKKFLSDAKQSFSLSWKKSLWALWCTSLQVRLCTACFTQLWLNSTENFAA